MKWSFYDDVYTPATEVVDVLPSGLYDAGVSWGRPFFKRVPLKTDRLYLLPRTATELVMKEIQNFWTKQADFAKYCVLYKRGILLYGAPGTGKTSVINLVCQEAAKHDAVCLRLKSRIENFKEAMKALRGHQPERPLLVFIEDIDRWSENGEEEELLDMLDGADQIDNVVYVATTNYLEKLPSRIVNRPSRFDRKIEIGPPDQATRKLFFESMAESKDPSFNKWSENTEGMTFAHLKELFISVKILGNAFDETVAVLREMEEDEPDEDEDEDESDS